MVKNPPSRAADQASVLGWRTKIPSATGQLESLQVTREEPEHHSGDQTTALPTPKKKNKTQGKQTIR